MSSDFTANTSLPVDYMDNNSIPPYVFDMFLMPLIQQKTQHPSLLQLCVTGFPEKGICPPVSPEILFMKSKEEPLGKNFSVFNLKQAFKLQLEGSGHERKGSTQRAINNLLLYKMLA